MENDTEVFYAIRVDPRTGEHIRTERTGTREAIHRDGCVIDPMSQGFCPHEWIDSQGYVDLELSMLHPYPSSRPANGGSED
jgi:hypothetical protein